MCTPSLTSARVKALVLLWVLLFRSPLHSFPGAMQQQTGHRVVLIDLLFSTQTQGAALLSCSLSSEFYLTLFQSFEQEREGKGHWLLRLI